MKVLRLDLDNPSNPKFDYSKLKIYLLLSNINYIQIIITSNIECVVWIEVIIHLI